MRASAALLAMALVVMPVLLEERVAGAAPPFQGAWYYTCPLDSIMGPVDIASTAGGDVLVCQRLYRAERFSGTGTCISHWYINSAPSQLHGIDELPGGGAIVLDYGARKLRTYDAFGSPVAAWGTFGTGVGQIEGPTAVVVDRAGEVLVPDGPRQRVLVFSSSGTFLREWTPTVGPGQIAVDDSGYVYIANPTTGQMAMYREDGSFLRNIGTPGFAPGQLKNPEGIAVSPDGLIYVSDALLNVISVFTRTGTFLERFGSPGSGDNQFNGVGRMTFDPLGNLYVVDENNLRICKFGPGPSPSTRRSWGQLKVMHR
jgi:hypothetical protein